MADFTGSRPLMISMGFNGYQWSYRRNIKTQRDYARRHGYDYVFVEKPAFTNLLMECAWLKIPLMISALKSGRPLVLYIDSDIEVKPDTPALETLLEDGKSLYMGNGFSGRLNSGVILSKNDENVVGLLQQILDNALMVLPEEDNVGWGENGHVIHFAKNFPGLKVLDFIWNNNRDPEAKDYFRHYSAGPMRKYYQFTPFEKIASKTGKLYIKAMKKLKPANENVQSDFFAQLNFLSGIVKKHYSEFKA